MIYDELHATVGLARPVTTEKITQCPYNHDTATPQI